MSKRKVETPMEIETIKVRPLSRFGRGECREEENSVCGDKDCASLGLRSSKLSPVVVLKRLVMENPKLETATKDNQAGHCGKSKIIDEQISANGILPNSSSSGSRNGEVANVPGWKAGDLAWARVGHHPFWPCLIAPDDTGLFFKTKKSRSGLSVLTNLHVFFYGDNGRHSWVSTNSMMKFEGKDHFVTMADRARCVVKKIKKTPQGFTIRQSAKSAWDCAVREAEEAWPKSIFERQQFFNENFPEHMRCPRVTLKSNSRRDDVKLDQALRKRRSSSYGVIVDQAPVDPQIKQDEKLGKLSPDSKLKLRDVKKDSERISGDQVVVKESSSMESKHVGMPSRVKKFRGISEAPVDPQIKQDEKLGKLSPDSKLKLRDVKKDSERISGDQVVVKESSSMESKHVGMQSRVKKFRGISEVSQKCTTSADIQENVDRGLPINEPVWSGWKALVDPQIKKEEKLGKLSPDPKLKLRDVKKDSERISRDQVVVKESSLMESKHVGMPSRVKKFRGISEAPVELQVKQEGKLGKLSPDPKLKLRDVKKDSERISGDQVVVKESSLMESKHMGMPSCVKKFQGISEVSQKRTPSADIHENVDRGLPITEPGPSGENFHDGGWREGDLAWARLGGFPFWPCIVARDEKSGLFTKTKKSGRGLTEQTNLHVYFYGDNGRHSWVSSSCVIKFEGLEHFKSFASKMRSMVNKNDRKFSSAFCITPSAQSAWEGAGREAEEAWPKSREKRLKSYREMFPVAMKEEKNVKRTKGAAVNKMKIKSAGIIKVKVKSQPRDEVNSDPGVANEKVKKRRSKKVDGFRAYVQKFHLRLSELHPHLTSEEVRELLEKTWSELTDKEKIAYGSRPAVLDDMNGSSSDEDNNH